MSKRKKNNIIIGSLLAVVLLMAVGYAAFSSVLNINGTGSITSSWNIKITNVEVSNIVGDASDGEGTTSEDLTATINSNLVSPGDSITYDVTVRNDGSLDAVLTDVNLTESTNPAISFSTSNLEAGNELGVGEEAILKVTITYNDVTEQPVNTSSSLNVTLTYSQKGSSTVIPGEDNTSIGGQDVELVSIGDGLYEDKYQSGRFIYKGANPNNYIQFDNGEVWRIISKEADGTYKIVKDESIGSFSWDALNTRNGVTSTYCVNSDTAGCNAWSSTTNLIGTITDFTLHYPNGNAISDSEVYSGTVTNDSSLNTYLNNDYYNNLSSDVKQYIVSHIFNVGTPGYNSDNEEISMDIEQESLYKWNGKIGLMNVTDILMTTNNVSCTSLNIGYNNGQKSLCSENNWLWKGITEWTLSPCVTSGRGRVWRVTSGGYLMDVNAFNSYAVRPVVFLKSTITLSGAGTQSAPFVITN